MTNPNPLFRNDDYRSTPEKSYQVETTRSFLKWPGLRAREFSGLSMVNFLLNSRALFLVVGVPCDYLWVSSLPKNFLLANSSEKHVLWSMTYASKLSKMSRSSKDLSSSQLESCVALFRLTTFCVHVVQSGLQMIPPAVDVAAEEDVEALDARVVDCCVNDG